MSVKNVGECLSFASGDTSIYTSTSFYMDANHPCSILIVTSTSSHTTASRLENSPNCRPLSIFYRPRPHAACATTQPKAASNPAIQASTLTSPPPQVPVESQLTDVMREGRGDLGGALPRDGVP